MKTINVNRRIGMGSPEEEARRFATSLLSDGSLDGDEVLFDVRDCDACRLISPFIYSWLEEMQKAAPRSLQVIRQAKWIARFRFQEECIAEWVASSDSEDVRSSDD
ncbi:hypothetical protein SH528x_002168 [Novipirellula sp. SH528]|uniref:hypothetical protein n=1 Tax=Novipirellula sp. SH528 TaxID=3454466 RepID=UPI003FA0F1BF